MKIILLYLIATTCFAQDYIKDVISDPTISLRCKRLIEERNQIVKIGQRLSGLMQRNNHMLKIVPANKKQALMKLNVNRTQLRSEIRLGQLKIRAMEENIVRKGCPGMRL